MEDVRHKGDGRELTTFIVYFFSCKKRICTIIEQRVTLTPEISNDLRKPHNQRTAGFVVLLMVFVLGNSAEE